MGSLWVNLTYLKYPVSPLNCVCLGSLDLSKKVLLASVGQTAAKLWTEKKICRSAGVEPHVGGLGLTPRWQDHLKNLKYNFAPLWPTETQNISMERSKYQFKGLAGILR